MDFVVTATHFLRLSDACIIFVSVRKYNHVSRTKTLTEDRKREKCMNLREKNYSMIETWECEWKQNLRENDDIKSFVRSSFPFKRLLSFKNLLHRIRSGELFGYVQCDISVPDNLEEKFATFSPLFKNTLVSRSDIGEIMKHYEEENKLLTQPRKMLISSYHLT